MTDHTVTLTQAERARVSTNQRPKDAATMLIIDRTSARPKVLMGKRHQSHKFMPGKYVFPGGRLDDGDRRMVATGALPQICEDRLLKRAVRPSIGKARALALAAIRETFEETGLLFGTDEFGAPEIAPEGSWSDFARHGTTMALFLSAARSRQLQEELLDGGYPPDTPCVVAYQCTWPDELLTRCRLDELAETVRAHRLWKHTLVLVGPALAAGGTRSHLYHPGHFHGHRRAEPRARKALRGG